MEWIEVIIKTSSEAVEPLSGLLMVNNIMNIRIIDDEEVNRFLLDHPLNWDYKDDNLKNNDGAQIIFYIQDDEIGYGLLEKVKTAINEMTEAETNINFGNLTVSHGSVNDDDWLHEWKKTYKPFKIGEKVVVRPYWEEYKPCSADAESNKNEIIFTIDPGSVFGTGLHATTQLCVLAMEKIDLKNKQILDVGCGSGILSVIALLSGATEAAACDIDPSAVRSAKENARLNNIEETQYEVINGEINVYASRKFDVIFANIVADVIMGLAPSLHNYLNNEGIFIASGIIDDREQDVKSALEKEGFIIKDRLIKDGWVCLIA